MRARMNIVVITCSVSIIVITSSAIIVVITCSVIFVVITSISIIVVITWCIYSGLRLCGRRSGRFHTSSQGRF